MTDTLHQPNTVRTSLNSVHFADPICTSVSGDLKTKSFFQVMPNTPRTPGGSLINVTSVLLGSPPKDRAPIMLLPISENSIIRRRKMMAEEQLSEDFTKKLKTTDQMTT